MATGFYAANGLDFDSIFAGRLTPSGGNLGFRTSDSVDIGNRFEKYNGVNPLGYDVGFRASDGVDLRLKLATVASQPRNWSTVTSNAFATPTNGQPAIVGFEGNGVVSGYGGNSDSWSAPNAAGVGNLYQILNTITGTSGTGINSIITGTWINIDARHALQIQKTSLGSFSVSGNSQIRRKSDGVVVCSGPWQLNVTFTND